MKFLVFCMLFVGLQVVSAQNQTVRIAANYTSPENSAVVFNLKKALVLSCNITIEGQYDKASVEWKKDDVLVTQVDSLKGRFKTANSSLHFTLTVANSESRDVGNWSCSALIDGQNKATVGIRVVTTINARIKNENINVVEGEKLRIECNVLGHPYPSITWTVESENNNGTEYGQNIIIQDYKDDTGNNVENGVLLIEKVDKKDRGTYTCIAVNRFWDQDRHDAPSTVRVKDKYAALWPFLGICLEVIVLCAIIIIYEKKRNKSELEESDTDQSPDQKNTPDHGKEANLRHRQ